MPTKELKTYTLAEMKDKYIGKAGTSTSAMFLQSFAELCGCFTEVLSPPKSQSRLFGSAQRPAWIETVTNCNQLKMPAPDGKMRLKDVAYIPEV